MTQVVRVVATVVAAVATFYFVFWLPFAILFSGAPLWMPLAGSAACAVLVGRWVWRRSGSASGGLTDAIARGAAGTGAVGFCAGFFGPMLLAPGANQGPLLGIFITGPLGFLLGGAGGAVYWFVRGRHEPSQP